SVAVFERDILLDRVNTVRTLDDQAHSAAEQSVLRLDQVVGLLFPKWKVKPSGLVDMIPGLVDDGNPRLAFLEFVHQEVGEQGSTYAANEDDYAMCHGLPPLNGNAKRGPESGTVPLWHVSGPF